MSRPRLARKVPPRSTLHDEPEKRRAILHAAVKVFAEKGYHGCRIADVARVAGVAYGLVYHYFQDKEALLENVFAEQWAIFVNAIRAIADGPGSAPEKLAGVCHFAVDVFKHAPAAVRVLLLEVARTPNVVRAGSTRQTLEAAVELVSWIVRDGQAKGELRRDADPVICAAALLGALELSLTGMVVGIVQTGSEAEVERAKEQIVRFVLSGVRP